jgi:hypothetical protein
MAEVATPSGAAMFDGGATVEKKKLEKPEKPDEEAYKANLKKAEKEHADSMTKLVRCYQTLCTNTQICSRRRQTACTHTDQSEFCRPSSSLK